MKVGYIVAIISIALMIVLSGCGTKEQPAPVAPSAPEEQPPQVPAAQPEVPAQEEPTAAPPAEEVKTVPETDVQNERSSAPEGKEILSGFGCDAASGSASFTVTNVGEKTLTIDNGQGLTGKAWGEQTGMQNDWIKVMFNGRALRMLNCEKLDLAPGEVSKCSQTEGLVFRTADSSAYSDVPYNQLLIKTQSGDHKKQVYCS